MKRITCILLVLAMAMALSACGGQADAPASDVTPSAAPAPSSGAAQPDPNRAYALEKLNEVNDMVLNRQMVPQDYLRYLDEPLAIKMVEYNSTLSSAKAITIRYAKGWADSFRNMTPEDDWYDAAFASYGRYLEEGDNYFRFIDEFSTALLYPNSYDFPLFGTVVGYPAGSEAGGSGGLWATGFYLSDSEKQCISALTALVDDLLDQFDAARAAWAQAD